MVVDTSAVLHILFEEPGWEEGVRYLLRQPYRLFSVASLVEAQAVIAGRTSPDAATVLDRLLLDPKLELMPLDLAQAQLARAAYLRYGKGHGHRAGLNYGDVMVYALDLRLLPSTGVTRPATIGSASAHSSEAADVERG